MDSIDSAERKTILICSNYAWTILNFRLSLIRALRSEGYLIEVLTQFDNYEEDLRCEVDAIRPLYISRKGVNPFQDARTLLQIYKTIKSEDYFAVFLFTIKPVIYGAFAARLLGVPSIPMITGVGTAMIKKSFLTNIVSSLYKVALKKSTAVLFQNETDMNDFQARGLVRGDQATLVPGSGIDLSNFECKERRKSGETVFLMVARLIWDKGVAEFVEAAKLFRASGRAAKFQILGPVDVENRTAVPKELVFAWASDGVIDYLGESDHVSNHMSDADCIVLPSYREGTSRVLLEACAMGRPTIATDVPGCREVTRPGINGFLCDPRSSQSLFHAMVAFSELDNFRVAEMGAAARAIVEAEYRHELVFDVYLQKLKELN